MGEIQGRLLTTKDAAAFLGVSAKLLERHRTDGSGPPYVKLAQGRSGRVRYVASDIDGWIAALRRTETKKQDKEPPGAAVAA